MEHGEWDCWLGVGDEICGLRVGWPCDNFRLHVFAKI